jgi:Acyl carrier protein
MTFQKVAEILSKHKDIPVGNIGMDSTLASLGLDSLDTVELIMQFEEEFGVNLSASENLKTVGDFVKIIEEGQKNDKNTGK